MTEQIQISLRRLKCICTLDSLKSVFNAFRKKPSLGVPEYWRLMTSTETKSAPVNGRVRSEIYIRSLQQRRMSLIDDIIIVIIINNKLVLFIIHN